MSGQIDFEIDSFYGVIQLTYISILVQVFDDWQELECDTYILAMLFYVMQL